MYLERYILASFKFLEFRTQLTWIRDNVVVHVVQALEKTRRGGNWEKIGEGFVQTDVNDISRLALS